MKKQKDNEFMLRIRLLNEFKNLIQQWFDNVIQPFLDNNLDEDFDQSFSPNFRKLRTEINQNLIAVKGAVTEAKCSTTVSTHSGRYIDLFENLLNSDLYERAMVPKAIDVLDQAIGVYESLKAQDGRITLSTREAIDVEAAIERALRPSFRNGQPQNEKEVQDSVETILNSLGIAFNREKDAATIGSRSSVPDFVLKTLSLAIEIKLAKQKHGASDIQEEIQADVSAYRTEWRHLLFVIYDLGVIDDPHKMRQDNMKLMGVTVVIIKH